MATVLIFLCNVRATSEDVCLDGDDFKEAKEAHHTGYSRGDQWKGTVPVTFTEEVSTHYVPT